MNKTAYKKNYLLSAKREENNLTQRELANKSGCSERSVQNYEAGKRKPTVDVALNMSDNLNINNFEDFKKIFGAETPDIKQKPDCSLVK